MPEIAFKYKLGQVLAQRAYIKQLKGRVLALRGDRVAVWGHRGFELPSPNPLTVFERIYRENDAGGLIEYHLVPGLGDKAAWLTERLLVPYSEAVAALGVVAEEEAQRRKEKQEHDDAEYQARLAAKQTAKDAAQ